MASIEYSRFKDETQLDDIIGLISNDLSEPYSIYVYRYFIQQW
jgi:peptide alpha-N-acetyltransferase